MRENQKSKLCLTGYQLKALRLHDEQFNIIEAEILAIESNEFTEANQIIDYIRKKTQ